VSSLALQRCGEGTVCKDLVNDVADSVPERHILKSRYENVNLKVLT